ncbi:restriction endonuclease subunit S [Lyngbya sp. CCY1209]|uniref:restriction endonuclease subunit S n=1 Tax=Lyngbya sp. CCY1209 TaxID=2886103 RepID=UPI002D21422B|nr:restriction endonuclease subunit S [Lyngbya sp. CCY1209]MEB3882173.1 restriction endonuclease subunit S [Lyngbya sp. CCY1209]
MQSESLEALPKGWYLTTIGEITLSYQTEQPKKYPSREFKYIDISSIDNSTQTITVPKIFLGQDAPSRARRVVKKDDVLFSTVRTYLKNIVRVPKELDGVLTSTGIAVLRPSLAVDSNFLFYYVLSEKFIRKISSTMDGTLYPAVTDNDVNNAEILLPPLNEQKRIVAKIEALQERSRRVKGELDTIAPLLDQFRRSVLAAAFRGDLTKDWRENHPDIEPASVLLERIKRERRRRWEEAELEKMQAKGKTPTDDKWKQKYKEPEPVNTDNLPELPEGWCWTKVQHIGDVQLGRQRSPKNHTGPYMRQYLRAANVTWSGLDLSDVKEMNFDPNDFKRFKLQYGDVLINEASGSQYEVGKPAIWRDEIPSCCIQNTLIRVRPLAPIYDFLYYYFLFGAISGAFGKASKGIGIHHLGSQILADWMLKLPPENEQKEIILRVGKILHAINTIEEQYKQAETDLETLNQAILAKAFRGELVPQDPDDEPASVLLERIRQEREAKGKSGKKTKRKPRKTAPKTEIENPTQLKIEGID